MKTTKFVIIFITILAIALCLGIHIGRAKVDGSIQVHVQQKSDHDGLININNADVSELSSLPGISPAMARRIVDYREDIGRFHSLYDLLEIPGFSYAMLDPIKDYVTVNE